MWRVVGHTEIFTPTMAARVAALALALGFLLQVAAKPTHVPIVEHFCPYPGFGGGEFIDVYYPGNGGFDFGNGGFNGYSGVVENFGGVAVGLGPVVGGILPGSVGPTQAVGPAAVVATSAGPTSSYTTSPFCQTAVYDAPATSKTVVKSGPVKEQLLLLDGPCESSCAATRAKCGGTTKNVLVAEATVIPVDSITRSEVHPIDAAKTFTSVQPGPPEVTSEVLSGPVFAPGYGYDYVAPGFGTVDVIGTGYGVVPFAGTFPGSFPGHYHGHHPVGPAPLPGPGCCPCY